MDSEDVSLACDKRGKRSLVYHTTFPAICRTGLLHGRQCDGDWGTTGVHPAGGQPVPLLSDSWSAVCSLLLTVACLFASCLTSASRSLLTAVTKTRDDGLPQIVVLVSSPYTHDTASGIVFSSWS